MIYKNSKTMNEEERQLLMNDLCVRLPHGVKVSIDNKIYPIESINIYEETGVVDYTNDLYTLDDIKPYLRPMSSMTNEEKKEYNSYCFEQPFLQKEKTPKIGSVTMCVDWLNAHHFDFRNLIERGLALEAHIDMYNTKK